jgi:hypothetical protein
VCNRCLIAEYLEQKVQDDEETDDEYELYLSYKRYGKKVFYWDEFKDTFKKLRREFDKLYEGEC